MIKIEKAKVFNFEGAFRGLRNPMNSWEKSDSRYCSGDKCFYTGECWNDFYRQDINLCSLRDFDETGNNKILKMQGGYSAYIIGPNDMNLAQRMICGGTDESKFMRQIFVTMDITAPLYWWKEFDTYKVGTVANSCSTMHKITEKEFTLKDFSCDHLFGEREYDMIPSSYLDKMFLKVEEENNKICFWTPVSFLEAMIEELNFYRKRYIETKDKNYWWQIIQLLPSSYNQKRTVTLNYQVLRAMYFARKSHKLDEWREFCSTIKTLPYAKELICYKKEKNNGQ